MASDLTVPACRSWICPAHRTASGPSHGGSSFAGALKLLPDFPGGAYSHGVYKSACKLPFPDSNLLHSLIQLEPLDSSYSPSNTNQHEMKSFSTAILASFFATVAYAQNIVIAAPAAQSSITPGESIRVQVNVPVGLFPLILQHKILNLVHN